MKNGLKPNDGSLHLDQNYKHFLTNIKGRLKTAQIRAALAANSELIKFYWELGTDLIEKQKKHQWGSGFLEQFSHDMRQNFPEMQGFSVSNLQRMKQFATRYSLLSITAQAVPQLPWGHIIRLMQMIKDDAEREWYAQQTIKNGWSRSVLEMQIESELYERQAESNKKINNFHKQLPALQSDLANEMLKDPYNFDFLTIQGKAHERAIEGALVTHIRDFLIELKATKFKPEHTGQLGFYMAAVDDLMRKEGDNQTIGIILCKSKNKVVAEYALRNMKAPIGISEYTLAKALPNELKASLPTVEEIEAELNETSHEK